MPISQKKHPLRKEQVLPRWGSTEEIDKYLKEPGKQDRVTEIKGIGSWNIC